MILGQKKGYYATLWLTREGWRPKAVAMPSSHPTSHCASAFSLMMTTPLTLGTCAKGMGVAVGTAVGVAVPVTARVLGVSAGSPGATGDMGATGRYNAVEGARGTNTGG